MSISNPLADPQEEQSSAARPATAINTSRWQSSLLKLYDSLTRNDSVRPVDLIFVMSGRMERKHYGLGLYRAGVAPRLVLSVGRFEVSKMRNLGLENVDEFIALRDRTPPDERHFFVTVDTSGSRFEKVRLPRWNTYGEALGFRRTLEREPARRVIVVSTDVHLRRVALTFSKVCHDLLVEFFYCPVRPSLNFLTKERWWSRADDRRFVVKEMMKLAGYRLILSTPAWAVRRLMWLQGD